jgi:hypothetical protein
LKRANFSVRSAQPRQASSSPVMASVSSMLDRWVVALRSFQCTGSASSLIMRFGWRSMCWLGLECRGFPSRAASGSPQHPMFYFCECNRASLVQQLGPNTEVAAPGRFRGERGLQRTRLQPNIFFCTFPNFKKALRCSGLKAS